MAEEKLVIMCIPSLVATLLKCERDKGSPLTEAEVVEIADKAPAVAMPEAVAREVAAGRGYEDLPGNNIWEEWQCARLDLI